jgi:hypothetical protein
MLRLSSEVASRIVSEWSTGQKLLNRELSPFGMRDLLNLRLCKHWIAAEFCAIDNICLH